MLVLRRTLLSYYNIWRTFTYAELPLEIKWGSEISLPQKRPFSSLKGPFTRTEFYAPRATWAILLGLSVLCGTRGWRTDSNISSPPECGGTPHEEKKRENGEGRKTEEKYRNGTEPCYHSQNYVLWSIFSHALNFTINGPSLSRYTSRHLHAWLTQCMSMQDGTSWCSCKIISSHYCIVVSYYVYNWTKLHCIRPKGTEVLRQIIW